MESRITAELMLEHGMNNVRGSMFCTTQDYHIGDLDGLTRFLGQYQGYGLLRRRREINEDTAHAPHP